jgi:hypothetical protein
MGAGQQPPNSAGKSVTDGIAPGGSVTFDRNGNMFGTTQDGGSTLALSSGSLGKGIIWKLTYSGIYEDIHDFGGTVLTSTGTSVPDGFNPQSPVSFDSSGNMYGSAENGGAHGYGMIWEVTTAGKYIDLHDFGGQVKNASGTTGLDGKYPVSAVTIDSNGNLYGTTSQGGPFQAVHGPIGGNLWEIPKGGEYTDLHDFGGMVVDANGFPGRDGSSPLTPVIFDSAGDLVGVTSVGGPYGEGFGMLWKLSTTGTYTDLHDFGGTYQSAAGDNVNDGFYPESVIIDSDGTIYGTALLGGAINDLGMIWRLQVTGRYTDIHDFGGSVFNANGKLGPDGYEPTGQLAIDTNNNLYGTASIGGPFQAPIPSPNAGGLLWEIDGSGFYQDLHDFGYGKDGNTPTGLTISELGNFYGTTTQGGTFTLTLPPANTPVATGTAWELVPPLQLRTFDLAEPTTVGTIPLTGTLSLSVPAPVGGTNVTLISNSALVTVPSSVFVPANQVGASFTVKTAPVSVATTATITAAIGKNLRTRGLLKSAPSLLSVTSFLL